MTEEIRPIEPPAPIPPHTANPSGMATLPPDDGTPPGNSASVALPLAILSLLGVLALAAFVIWGQPPREPPLDPARIDALEQRANAPRPPSIDPARIDALEKQASAPRPAAIDPARIDALEKQASAPRPAAIDPARIDTLEKQASAPKPAPIDPARIDAMDKQGAALADRLTQIEQKPAPFIPLPPDLTPLEQRIDALEKRLNSPTDNASRGDLAALAGRVDQLTARADALGKSQQADLGAVTARLDGHETKLQADDKLAGQIGGLADKQSRTALLQAAAVALDGGQKLGDVPGAPPALQKFAQTAPPTEAALRLSFDDAARSVQAASRPTVDEKPFLERMWFKAQQSVMVRQGDHVVLGDPVTGVLEHARLALYAGDVAGAVSTLDQLAGPAAAAMAPWKANAQALLDARAALLSLARG